MTYLYGGIEQGMKIRIKDNSIRLRLTQTEVETFGKTGMVESVTEFGGNNAFRYRLVKTGNEVRSLYENGAISIHVPDSVADDWVNSEEVGISNRDLSPTILVEKDFACLTVREGEDESPQRASCLVF